MKTLKHLMSIFLLALISWSCTDQLIPEETPMEGIPISIESELPGYTKATDTSFEEGDQIGLYIYKPEIYLENSNFSYQKGKFVPETPQVWYDGNDEGELIAYYPYQEKSWGKDRVLQFCVNADQRTHKNYTASDLMVARKRSRPSAEAVVLPFDHVLSKALITIDNQLGEDIDEVMFSGVKGSFFYHVDNGQIVLDGKEGIVKAARSNTDKRQWAMVLPPQNADPNLIILTVGNKEYRYDLDKTFRFEGGRCHNARITVDAGSASTEISSEIQDWLPGNDFNFGQDPPQKDWASLGKGHFIDDAVGPVIGQPVSVLEVEIEENIHQKGLYRIRNPYKNASYYSQFASDIPGELVFEVSDSTNVVHVRESSLGMKKGRDEFILSEKTDGYGGLDAQSRLIWFNRECLELRVGSSETHSVNLHGLFIIVLPGGELPPMDMLQIEGMTVFADGNGKDQIGVDLFVQPNYSNEIFYKFFDTRVDVQEEYDKYKRGELQMTQFHQPKAGMKNVIDYTPSKSGLYTVLVVGKSGSGNIFGLTSSCTYRKEGEVIPPPEVKLYAKQNPNYPEGELFLNIKVQEDVLNYNVKYAPVSDTSLTQSPNLYFGKFTDLKLPEGEVVNITGLKPSTEYRMTVSVTALDNRSYSYHVNCQTAAEASYSLLGEGRFTDNTSFIAWEDDQGRLVQNYDTPVKIYQDNSNPDKFRMLDPYKKYWANTDPGFVRNQLPAHNGHESPYVDFYRYTGPDGRMHVAFSEIDLGLTSPHYPGSSYYYSALGEIKYNSNQYCFVRSIEAKEGIFNLNPISAYIRNTPFYHGLVDFGQDIQIHLPQKGVDPDPGKPKEGIAFDYFEVPQTLKSKPEYKYILHSGETYTSHQKVRNYSACYDTRRHNPMWVAYPCHDIWWEGGYGRPVRDPWRPDPKMKESEQSIIYANDWNDWPWTYNNGKPADNKQYWTLPGASFYFTKGHLLRSAERGTRDRNTLFKMNEQTFYPTNISPERYSTVKRTSDKKDITHWALVEGIMPEKWRCSDTLYVVAGCYYGDDSITAIDASNNGDRSPDTKDCVVPTARWKVFLRTKSGVTGKPVSQCRADELMAIAFWFPQCLESNNQVSELPPLSEYAFSVDALEAKIGGEFNFFPQVPEEVCKNFNASDWPGLDDVFQVRIDSGYSGPYIH